MQAAATEPPHPAAEPASRALATWALQYAGSAANRLPLRAAATAVLCNLASAGRGLLEHLAAQGAIPVLAQLVASGLPALQAPALVTLRRLSLLPAATAAVAAVAGVPLCLQLLRDSNAAAVHAAAAAQLTAWAAHSAEDRLAAEAAGAVPLLLICLLGNSQRADQRYWLPSCVPEPAQFAVARAIQCLAPEGASLQHRGLLRLVSRMNPGGPTPWVEMDGLAMVAYDSNCGAGVNGEFARHVKLRLLLNAGAIPETVHVLRNSPEPNARALAAAVLRVCAARCQQPTLVASLPAIEAQTATEIVTAGSIPALLSAARSDSHERAQQKLQQAAMCALAQLSSHPSAHTALLEAGVVPVIVQLLFSSDPESAAALAAVDAAWCLAAGSPAVRQALLDSALVRALPAAMQQYHLDRTFVDLAQQVLCMLGATMGSTTTLVSPAGVSAAAPSADLPPPASAASPAALGALLAASPAADTIWADTRGLESRVQELEAELKQALATVEATKEEQEAERQSHAAQLAAERQRHAAELAEERQRHAAQLEAREAQHAVEVGQLMQRVAAAEAKLAAVADALR